jgi:exodeoxyribonuclease III
MNHVPVDRPLEDAVYFFWYYRSMKIISWNVNGIRAAHKKGALTELFSLGADIIGIQETKSTPDQLTDDIKFPPGYITYFDSSKIRKGYSGVAVYTKFIPEKIDY